MKTWHFEASFVALVLLIVIVGTGGPWIEWVGSAAVFFGFCYASVSFRMSEQVAYHEQQTGVTVVSCYKWSTRYYFLKEVLFFAYFAGIGAWSALVGVFVFILYPLWRRLWRKWKPYQPESKK